jgi:hypothetical protein
MVALEAVDVADIDVSEARVVSEVHTDRNLKMKYVINLLRYVICYGSYQDSQ